MPFLIPVVAAAAAAIGLTGVAATVATYAVVAAVTVATSIGVSYLARKLAAEQAGTAPPTSPNAPPAGVRLETAVGSDFPSEVIIGRVATAGQLIYTNTYHDAPGEEGRVNKFLQRVYVLSDGRCKGLNRVAVNGKWYSLNSKSVGTSNAHARYSVGGAQSGGFGSGRNSGFGSLIDIRFFDGRFDQLADQELVQNARPAGRWSNNHRGRNRCYASVTMEYDEEYFPGGPPEFLFEVDGLYVYDRRVNGASFDNEATWVYREDPATALYHCRRGIYVPTVNNGRIRIAGMGISAADLNDASYSTAANECDVLEGNEPRYRVSAILSDGTEHGHNVETLLAAMHGYEVERGGLLTCVPGIPQAVALTITDKDLIEGRPVTFSKVAPRDRIASAVYGEYLEPEALYQPTPLKPLESAGYEKEDGGERLPTSISLTMVRSRKQARRICRQILKESRYQATATITVRIKHLAVEVGDWIIWASDLGYATRTYLVAHRSISFEDGTITWQLRECAAPIYDHTGNDDDDYVIPPGDEEVPRQSSLLGFTVTPATITASGGASVPGFRVTWTPPEDPRIVGAIIAYRLFGETQSERVVVRDVGEGGITITAGIKARQVYQFHHKIITQPDRKPAWTSWANYTAPSVKTISDEDLTDNPPAVPTGLTLTSSAAVQGDGTSVARLRASWTSPGGSSGIAYDVGIKEGSGGALVWFTTGETAMEWTVRSGFTYYVQVRSKNRVGAISAYTAFAALAVESDNVAPAAVTGFSATGAFRTIWASWNPVADADLKHYEVVLSSTTDRTAGTSHYTRATSIVFEDITAGQTRYLWIRASDNSGNSSAWSARSEATTRKIDAASHVADAILQASHFTAGLEPPLNVSALPTPSASYRPRTVYHTGEKRLYSLNDAATAWVPHEVQATQVVGQLLAGQIAAGAITAEKLGVTGRNLLNDFTFQAPGAAVAANVEGWASFATGMIFSPIASKGNAIGLLHTGVGSASYEGAVSNLIPIQPNRTYAVSVQVRGSGATEANRLFRLQFYDKDGVQLSTIIAFDPVARADGTPGTNVNALLSSASVMNAWTAVETYIVPETIDRNNIRPGVNATRVAVLPANAAYVRLQLLTQATGASATADTQWLGPAIRDAESGQIVAQNIKAASITARELATSTLITETAQIGEAVVTSAKIASLDAAKIQGGTVLAGTITVGGETLSATTGRASDPAARVNAGTTQIKPGLIEINGSSGVTLADWRQGGDTTKIAGGQISANTIAANAIQIGVRGVVPYSLEFEHNSDGTTTLTNSVAWSSGVIVYTDDSGNSATASITAGTAAWSSGTMYIYWTKGDTVLRTTTSAATAFGANNVVLATYRGGVNLVSNYGRTIIDGANIKTGTVTATQIAAATITATQLAASAVTTGKLAAGAVTAGKIEAGTITADRIVSDSLTRVSRNSVSQTKTINTDNPPGVLVGSLQAPRTRDGRNLILLEYIITANPSGGLNYKFAAGGNTRLIWSVKRADGTTVTSGTQTITHTMMKLYYLYDAGNDNYGLDSEDLFASSVTMLQFYDNGPADSAVTYEFYARHANTSTFYCDITSAHISIIGMGT